MKVFRALANPSFALLWSGRTISRLGDSFYTVALALWVLEKTHSAAAMGLVLVCSTVPMLVLLLLGGVFVDRFSRLLIMLSSDTLRAVIVGVIALLAVSGLLSVWHVLVMSALFGVVGAFFSPAASVVVPDIVSADDRPSANALGSISGNLIGIIGPAIAGLVVARGGPAFAFALDSLSFVISACCLLKIPRRSALLKPGAGDGSVLADLREGIQTVLGSPWVWMTIAIAGISNITLTGPFEATLPLLVAQHVGSPEETYGIVMALASAGSLLATVFMGRMKRLRRRGYLVYGSWLGASLMLVILGLPLGLVGISLAVCLWNGCVTIVGLAWINSLQELVPSERLGRVFSIDALGSLALVPVGYALSGFAADRLGASTVFLLGGLLSGLVIALGLLHPGVRGVD